MVATKNLNNYALWKEYDENNNPEARKKLILAYLPLVKYQAGRVNMLVPDFVEKDDLESFGVIGLIDAIEKFDYRRGYKFTTYASKRIRGEIIDHLRKLDWLPHSLRRKGKKVKEMADKMQQELGRKPELSELSTELDISREKIAKIYHQLHSADWVSLFAEMGQGRILDFLKEDRTREPDKQYQDKEAVSLLTETLQRLPEQEQLVISLYYYEELTQNEIAEILELSPARISQIHKKAVYRLRGYLSTKKEQFV